MQNNNHYIMKKTEYFSSRSYNIESLKNTIIHVKQLRDDFLNEIADNILQIENESIQFVTGSNDKVVAVLSLTYLSNN